MSSSTSSHTILITVKQAGLDQVNTAVNGFAKTSQAATKSTNALGTSWNKASTGAVKFAKSTTTVSKGFTLVGKGATTAGKSTDTYTKSSGKASTSTDKLSKGIGVGGRGLAFGFIGLGSAVAEAAGMLSMYFDAAAKASDAQAEVNRLTGLGITSGTAYSRATNELAEAQRGLNFVLRNTILSITDIATFVLLAANAIANMRNISQSATTSTQALTTATEALAAAQTASSGATAATTTAVQAFSTATEAATSGVQQFGDGFATLGTRLTDTNGGLTTLGTSTTALNTALTDGTTAVTELFDANGNLITGLTDTTTLVGTRGNGLVGGYDALTLNMEKNAATATKSQSIWTKLGTAIKALPSVFLNVGKSITGFFTNFGANMTKLGGWLKTAGTAVLAFGRSMMIAFLSNPITAIIAGISAAVLALATDFGGIRTAINNAGVAIGDAIPAAKGLLQTIGEMGNAALDYIANALGVKTATQQMGEEQIVAQKKMASLQQTMHDFGTVTTVFDGLRKGIGDAIITINDYNAATADTADTHRLFAQTVEQALGSLKEKYPAVANEVKIFRDTVDSLSLAGKSEAEIEQIIGDLLTWLQGRIVAVVGAQGDLGKVMSTTTQEGREASIIAAELGVQDQNLADQIALVNRFLGDETMELGNLAKANEDVAMTVANFIVDHQELNKESQILIKNLTENAGAVQFFGDNLEIVDGTIVDIGQSMLNLVAYQEKVGDVGGRIWSYMNGLIMSIGEEALPLIQTGIDYVASQNEDLGEVLQTLFDDWNEGYIVIGERIYALNEAEKDQQKEVDKTRQKINEKAKELGILAEITGKTNEESELLIDLEEEAQSTITATTKALQQEARERGANLEVLKGSDSVLRDFIMTHEEDAATTTEVANQYVLLTSKREDETKALEVERKVNEQLVKTMTDAYDTTKMTADGLADLITVLDDTANAEKIAADNIALYDAELKRDEAQIAANREELVKYASMHGVVIPQAILDKGIPAIKEFIEATLGIGEAAKKMRDEYNTAFDEMVSKGQEMIGNLIDEHIIEGESKKIMKHLEDLGLKADDIAAVERMISIGLDKTDAEEGIVGFTEFIAEEFGKTQGFSQDAAHEAVMGYANVLAEEFPKQGDQIVSIANAVWEKVQNEAPANATGDYLIQQFGEGIKNPTYVQEAMQEAGLDPLADSMLEMHGIAEESGKGIPEKIAAALSSGKTVIQNATLTNIIDPITGEVETIPNKSQTAIAPIEGVFSTAFLNASKAATFELNTFISQVQTAMSSLLMVNKTVLNAMDADILAFIAKYTTHVQSINEQTSLIGIAITANWDIWVKYFEGLTAALVAFSQLWVSFVNETMVANIQIMNENIGSSYTDVWVPYFTSLTDSIVLFSQLWVTFIDETLIANLVKLKDEILRNWTEGWLVWTTNIGEALLLIGNGIDQFYTDIFEPFNEKMMDGLKKQIDSWIEWAEKAGGALVLIGNGIDQFYNNVFEPFSTGFVTAMDEMSSKVESFAEACVAAFAKVAQSADDARTSVEDLQSAIDALKDKTVTITTVYKTVGSPARFGGSIIGYARAGDSWIQDRPTTLGGMRVSEGSKPELITATPLSNPYDMSDKKINIPTPNLQIPNAAGGLGGGGGGQPITVTGDIYLTVKTQSGETLANEVKPYLLRGFSGIT